MSVSREDEKNKIILDADYAGIPGASSFKVVDNEVYLGMLKELIEEGRDVPLTVTGGSMTPFVIHKRDSVVLSPVRGSLKRGDVVMYQREGGMYVLHRIVKVCRDGTYVLCGDAQTVKEPGVRRDQIFARVISIKRKGKIKKPGSFFWFFFSKIWSRLIPFRRRILKASGRLKAQSG